MKKVIVVAAGLLLVVALASGASPARSGLDKKLDNTSFIEDGKLVSLIVGTKPSRVRGARDFMPVEIAVVNKRLASLTLTPESFFLVDEEGRRYPTVGGKELADHYGDVDVDRRLGVVGGLVAAKFKSYEAIPATLTPSFDKPFAEEIRLPRFSYATDFLYFPKPETGVRGRLFELWMESPDLPDPVFVVFEVGGKPIS